MIEDPSDPKSLDTALAFDKGKQSAIVGWQLKDHRFAHQCARSLRSQWFASPVVAKIFESIAGRLEELGRVPKPMEVLSHPVFSKDDARAQERAKEALADALRKTETYKLDLLRKEMTGWMHAVIFHQAMTKAQVVYNAGKVEEAWGLIEDATLMKLTGTFEDGVNQGFKSSADRMRDERVARLLESSKILPYGNKFLDDALVGLFPRDLVVVGAKPGSGKTQFVAGISLAVAQMGFPVNFFSLESEEDEIERRIKYGLVSDRYYKGGGKAHLRYAMWRAGKLDKILRPVEEEVQPELEAAVANLRTLYRTSGDFNLRSLERELLRVVDKSKLIVIDHLHYIDVDESEEENRAYKRVMKIVRDVVLHYSVPVILVAHLRKNQSYKTTPLVNGIEDFHGTSDVPKIATTCVMIGPAVDREQESAWLNPTYVNVAKNRMEGGITRYTALMNFDSRCSKYQAKYTIGRLAGGRDEWEPIMEATKLPPWADPPDIDTIHDL